MEPLSLHTPNEDNKLSKYYDRAFKEAEELRILTAYLTNWDKSRELNENCLKFLLIIGTDFGITKKAACRAVLKWLPKNEKHKFQVLDKINGFHPKVAFWKESSGKCFAIVGSSNLTRAAFDKNYEANIFLEISDTDYKNAVKWVDSIKDKTVVVSEDWLENHYNETTYTAKGSGKKTKNGEYTETLKLPRPKEAKKYIDQRRDVLIKYKKKREGLIQLFRDCAAGKVTSRQFYEQLPAHWSVEVGDRMQGQGWVRKGQGSDFQALSESYVRIIDAKDEDRDDVVAKEIDSLHEKGVSTRKAFLSEMLCLRFPEKYPVWDTPVKDYLADINFRAPRGASEGAYYITLAKTLRAALRQNPEHPAENLAELDTVIWLAYH